MSLLFLYAYGLGSITSRNIDISCLLNIDFSISVRSIFFTAAPLTIRNYLNRRMWQAWIRVTLIRDMNRTHPSPTRRKAILGGSTPASMRVMVVDKCVRFTSLAVNGTAVNIFIYFNLARAYKISLFEVYIFILVMCCIVQVFYFFN